MNSSDGLTTIYCDQRVGYAQNVRLMSSHWKGHVDTDGQKLWVFFLYSFLILNTVFHSSFVPFLLEKGHPSLQTVPSVQGSGQSPELNYVKLWSSADSAVTGCWFVPVDFNTDTSALTSGTMVVWFLLNGLVACAWSCSMDLNLPYMFVLPLYFCFTSENWCNYYNSPISTNQCAQL